MAIDVNIDTNKMLDIGWELLQQYFTEEEVQIRKDVMKKYWTKEA